MQESKTSDHPRIRLISISYCSINKVWDIITSRFNLVRQGDRPSRALLSTAP